MYEYISLQPEMTDISPSTTVSGAFAAQNNFDAPEVIEKEKTRRRTKTIHIPRYHVVLWDDNDHTYDYVIEMLMKVFGHSRENALRMAVEVDSHGRVIVDTTTKERAELKRDQIHGYGADWRLPHCKGSMSASIEPAEDGDS